MRVMAQTSRTLEVRRLVGIKDLLQRDRSAHYFELLGSEFEDSRSDRAHSTPPRALDRRALDDVHARGSSL